MIYTAYDGITFENLNDCIRHNKVLLKKRKDEICSDPIYLLSKKEYETYKGRILLIPVDWWLRTPSDSSFSAVTVRFNGTINGKGELVSYVSFGVRPALNLERLKPKIDTTHYQLMNDGFPYRFVWAGATWRTLEAGKIAIAEMPIFYSKFDDKLNDYASSLIRSNLLQWYNSRINSHFVVQEVMGL